jgi:hypothetical protein
MDSRMNLEIARTHIADLERRADAHRWTTEATEPKKAEKHEAIIALRLAAPDENGDLLALALLDSADPLQGEALVGVVDGKVIAAVSLRDGRVIADPFTATAEVRDLLEARVAQLRRGPRRVRWPRRRLRPRLV